MFSRVSQIARRFPKSAVGAVVATAGIAYATNSPTMAHHGESTHDQLQAISDSLKRIEKDLGITVAGSKSKGPKFAPGLNFPRWTEKNKSLVKKCLTPEDYENLRHKTTPDGFTLDRAIQSGVDNQDSGVGIYAGDEHAYSVFAPVFDKVIEVYHGGYKPTDKHISDMDPSKVNGNPDPEGKYVISTRIRVGRNIRGLGLPPGNSREQRRTAEKLVTSGLAKFEGELAGKYFPLDGMNEADRKQLVADHFLFKKGDRFLESAGANRDWPESRGIFHNTEKTFLVWVNEEDQMRIISMQPGSDVKQVFERLTRGIAAVEAQVKSQGYEFAYNDHLGFIHSCPTNCGTGMRASVHAKLPHAGKHPDFEKWCKKLRLQPRGIHGEHSESDDGVYDLSNMERLGKSEVALVQTMIDGVGQLIAIEKELEAGKPVSFSA